MTKKDDSKWILNMGAGTVAVRDADVQLSLGMRVAMVKYGNYPDDADGSDSKTQGLKDLLERHKDVDIPVFAALGDPEKIGDLERRVGLIKKHVGRCDGSVEDFVKKEKENIALAIDLTDGNGVDQWNHDDLYKPYNLPFAVNGGGNKTLVNRFYFAGVRGTRVDDSEMFERYRNDNAMIVSCNSHATLTAFASVKATLGDKFESMVNNGVLVKLDRRWMDPGRAEEAMDAGKKRPRFTTLSNKPYHTDEMESLFPEFEGRIQTQIAKWPVEYFHTGMVVMPFNESITQTMLDDIRQAFIDYERAVFTRGDLSHERNINAAHWAKIPDGQLPYGVYTVNTVGSPGSSNVLMINFNTPQRDIVALPTADYILMRTGMFGVDSYEKAFEHVNEHARYFGRRPSRFGKSMEYSLHPKNYDRLIEEKGPSPSVT